jgi:hypothetical protein
MLIDLKDDGLKCGGTQFKTHRWGYGAYMDLPKVRWVSITRVLKLDSKLRYLRS